MFLHTFYTRLPVLTPNSKSICSGTFYDFLLGPDTLRTCAPARFLHKYCYIHHYHYFGDTIPLLLYVVPSQPQPSSQRKRGGGGAVLCNCNEKGRLHVRLYFKLPVGVTLNRRWMALKRLPC